MSWFVEHWIASSVLAAYVAALFYNAYLGNKAATGMGGYYVGNREMGGAVVGISFFATFASTNTFIGHAGKGYEYGVVWFTLAVLLIGFAWVSWRWIGPPLRRFAAEWDALTIPDYIKGRILNNVDSADRHPVLLLSASVIVFASLLYLLAIFKGAGHLFQIFLGVPYEVAVGVTLVVVVLYTSIGGFVSVVRTDAIQGVFMLVGAMTIFYFVTKAAGGVGAVTQLIDMPTKQHLFDLNGAMPFAVVLGVSLSGALKLIVDPRQLSRFYGLKNDAEVKRGMWIAIVGLTLILVCMFPVGIYAHLILNNVADTDLIVPTLVNDAAIFPLWVTDLLIVSIVSAAMSSMDSVLLVASSTLYKNLIAPFKKSGKRSALIAHRRNWFRLHRRLSGAQPPWRYRRHHYFLRQSLRGMFFRAGGVWSLRENRACVARLFGNALWYGNTHRMDCTRAEQPTPRGIPGTDRLHRYLPCVFQACGRSASG